MRLTERIAKNCRSRPPNNLNLANPEPHTDQVISTLWDAKEALIGCKDNMAVAIATYRALDQYWSSIWPWMLALSRGLLNQAAPSTPSELTNTKRLALMLSILLAYPVYNPANWRHSDAGCTVPENVLDSLIQSHPSILVLFTKIWLLADELELGDIVLASLMQPITLILENSTKSTGKFADTRILEDKPRDELGAIFTGSNLDLPGALLNQIRLELTLPSPDFSKIRHHLIYINVLVLNFSTKSVNLPRDFSRRGALSCISLTLKTLARRCYVPCHGTKTQSSAVEYLCLTECLQLVAYFVIIDAYMAIPLLDDQVLLHIFKLRGVIIEHVHRMLVTTPGIRDAAPLMVRLVNSIRKIQKIGLDNWDHPIFASGAPFYCLKETWDGLVKATFRNISISARYTSEARLLCGNVNCTNTEIYNATACRRCGGCKSQIYCSRSCQRLAWKIDHKESCWKTETDVDGTWRRRRLADHLEQQLLKFHVAVDYQELFMTKARELFFEYVVKPKAAPVIWVDYLKSPPTIEVASDADSRARTDALQHFQIIPERQGVEDLNGVLVCALIPWQGTEGSLLASYRDCIPEDKDVVAREGLVAISSPGQTRRQDIDHSNISGH